MLHTSPTHRSNNCACVWYHSKHFLTMHCEHHRSFCQVLRHSKTYTCPNFAHIPRLCRIDPACFTTSPSWLSFTCRANNARDIFFCTIEYCYNFVRLHPNAATYWSVIRCYKLYINPTLPQDCSLLSSAHQNKRHKEPHLWLAQYHNIFATIPTYHLKKLHIM